MRKGSKRERETEREGKRERARERKGSKRERERVDAIEKVTPTLTSLLKDRKTFDVFVARFCFSMIFKR